MHWQINGKFIKKKDPVFFLIIIFVTDESIFI